MRVGRIMQRTHRICYYAFSMRESARNFCDDHGLLLVGAAAELASVLQMLRIPMLHRAALQHLSELREQFPEIRGSIDLALQMVLCDAHNSTKLEAQLASDADWDLWVRSFD